MGHDDHEDYVDPNQEKYFREFIQKKDLLVEDDHEDDHTHPTHHHHSNQHHSHNQPHNRQREERQAKPVESWRNSSNVVATVPAKGSTQPAKAEAKPSTASAKTQNNKVEEEKVRHTKEAEDKAIKTA